MKKILVVDDAVTVRLYHKQLMESLGYSVDEAENGVEALEKGLCNHYDLYLVDVNMPKMDGYRFTEELRQIPELQSSPVIMISTEAEEKDKEKAFMSGANFYIVKPAVPEEIKEYVALLVSGEN